MWSCSENLCLNNEYGFKVRMLMGWVVNKRIGGVDKKNREEACEEEERENRGRAKGKE